jgi:hypothetical protein
LWTTGSICDLQWLDVIATGDLFSIVSRNTFGFTIEQARRAMLRQSAFVPASRVG